MTAARIQVRPGSPLPLGVRDCCDGFNFAVLPCHAYHTHGPWAL